MRYSIPRLGFLEEKKDGKREGGKERKERKGKKGEKGGKGDDC